MTGPEKPRNPAEMKRRLGIDRLVLQIHASSFPVDPDEDLGRGTPYSKKADKILEFAARLGFDTIQIGPMGLTERGNASPYNATIFSRNPMCLSLARLLDGGRISRNCADEIRAASKNTTNINRYVAAYDAYRRLSSRVCARADGKNRASAQRYLEANASWLVPDALYDVLCAEHGSSYWGDWGRTDRGRFDQQLFDPPAGMQRAAAERLGALRAQHARTIEDYALIQSMLAEEQRAFHCRMKDSGLDLLGDLQIGLSARDIWSRKSLFLENYRMGAPPSRTNPAGQPWGYRVFDPGQFGEHRNPGPVLQFVNAWLSRMMEECDGIRIDHPHGWIDPWVYRSDDRDEFRAVAAGARLFSSPDEPGHPYLRTYSVVSKDRIDRNELPYADGRVHALSEEHVTRYALLFDAIIRRVPKDGRDARTIVCEILSTLPFPVERVLKRYGLGRFRVAQKLSLSNPSDVYRIEKSQPEDWVMMSTHDTAGIWQLAEQWCAGSAAGGWGRYLAPQLVPESGRARFAAECAAAPGNLVHALFAALLACRARHVLVFFPDLFGMTDRYNLPGEVQENNWMLRVPSGFEKLYEERCARGRAIDIRKCFDMALEARESAG